MTGTIKAAVINAGWSLRRAWLWLVIPPMIAAACYGIWFGYWYVHYTSYFRIARIEVTGCVRSAAQEIITLSGVKAGESIFDKDLDDVADNISRHPWVNTVRVSRNLPREVRIAVVEHIPAALVAMNGVYITDADGEIFKRVVPGDDVKMPVITGLSREDYTNSREESRSRIMNSISLIEEIRKINPGREVSEVHVEAVMGYTVFLSDRAIEVRFGKGRFTERAEVLERVLMEAEKRQWQPRAVFLDNDFRTEWVAMRLR
jgi:hypothetical protein